MFLTVTAKILPSLAWRHKRPGFERPIAEGVNRLKNSHDPKLLGQEVSEIYVIDRIKKWWQHLVKDVKTGEVLHEESGLLENKR
jgi:hypothetical protein